MSLHYLKSLLARSAQLQREIETEQKRPKPDSLRLLKLKKIRLVVKDRLQRMARQYDAQALKLAFKPTQKA